MEEDTGSEETSSELRDDHTDTSSVEVPSVRPRRAVTLRKSIGSERPPLVERARRVRKTRSLSYTEEDKATNVKNVRFIYFFIWYNLVGIFVWLY